MGKKENKEKFIDLFNRSLSTDEEASAMICIMHEHGAEVATMGEVHVVVFAVATFFESMIKMGDFDRGDLFYMLAEAMGIIKQINDQGDGVEVNELI